MARLFISYSRADRQFVDGFVPLLRKVYGNDTIWFDDDIPGGHEWWRLILSEIGKCELFIYLLSNEALASPYCQAEFREALRLQKLVLPVVVRPKTQIGADIPGDLRDILQKIQWVDLSRGFKDYEATATLYAAINKLLEQAPARPPTPLLLQPVREPPVPDRKPRKLLTEPWAIIIAAVIGLIGIIVAALIGVVGNSILSVMPTDGVELASVTRPQSTSTVSPQLLSSTPLALVPSSVPSDLDAPSLTLHRWGDTVAICANEPADLGALHIVLGSERQVLGDVFPASVATQAGECWCLQQERGQFDLPAVCQEGNVSPRLPWVGVFWRNETVTLSLEGQVIKECNAQIDNNQPYSC